jgi:nucleoside-diphosphate-sugar epimerase
MIAITGGSGEIASRLAELLLGQEMSVILFINKEDYFKPEVIIRRRSIQEHKK